MPTALPPSSQGCGEGWELKPTWEEHRGEGVWSLQVVNEDALEGLAAGGLLVPGEGRRVDQGWSWSPRIRTTWLKAPHSHPVLLPGFRSESFLIVALSLSFLLWEMGTIVSTSLGY